MEYFKHTGEEKVDGPPPAPHIQPQPVSTPGRSCFFSSLPLDDYYFFYKFIYLFIYLWLRWVFIAARGLFSSCGERGLLFVTVRGLLTEVASLAAEHRL